MRGWLRWTYFRLWRKLSPPHRLLLWVFRPRLKVYAHGTFDVSQAHYRIYNDDGTEATSTPIAAEDTAATVAANFGADSAIVHLRITLDEVSGLLGGAATDDWQLQVAQNGGAFQNVGAATTIVKSALSANLTDGSATTDRATNGLTNPAGTFVAGEQCEDGLIDDMLITQANFTEVVYSIQVIGNDVANNDSLTFRVLLNGAVLFSYAVTPTITVSQTNPTISSASMGDAGRDFDAPWQDVSITFSETVDGAPAVDATVPGLTIGPSGTEGAVTYRSGDGTATWVVRRAVLAKKGHTWVIDYVMASGVILAVDDNAELRETANAAITNNLTARIRALLKNDAGSAITTACDALVYATTSRDSDNAGWGGLTQRYPNQTPTGAGLLDISVDGLLSVGTVAYLVVFNPRENASAPTSYARTVVVATTVT